MLLVPVYYIPALICIIFLLGYVMYLRKRLRAQGRPSGRAPKREKEEPAEGAIVMAEAVSSDVSGDALFATLSHELMTPLNGLLGVVQILSEEHPENEDFQSIEGCARHMSAVVSALVNHSKIQAEWDDLPEYREWISLFEITEQIKRHVAFRARLRGLELHIIHQDRTQRLRGDADHLRNIIENAILGSLEAVSLVDIPFGYKPLTLQWECSGDEVKVTINNPLEVYAKDRRQQIKTARGLSVGENLSRVRMEYLYWSVSSMLLGKYSGALFARPNPEGGVTTLLSFEMEQMSASPTDKLPIGGLGYEQQGNLSKTVTELPFKLSILVAEDDPVSRKLMETLLSLMGQETHFATNGREVLDLVSQSKSYDLILMDIDMPIMDGLSASLALRNGEVGEFGTAVPIVAVTAFNTLSDESRFKKAGMNYFLPKPFRLKHLREVLLEVVRSE